MEHVAFVIDHHEHFEKLIFSHPKTKESNLERQLDSMNHMPHEDLENMLQNIITHLNGLSEK